MLMFSKLIMEKPTQIMKILSDMNQHDRDSFYDGLTEYQKKQLDFMVSSESQKEELTNIQDFSEDDYMNLKSCDF